MEIIKLELGYLDKSPSFRIDRRYTYTCFRFDISEKDAPSWAKTGMRIERHGNYNKYGETIIDTFVQFDGEGLFLIAVIGFERDLVKAKSEKLEFKLIQE